MRLKDKKKYILPVGGIILQLLFIALFYAFIGKDIVQLTYSPEQFAQVEVVEKRETSEYSSGSHGYDYYVSFQFFDGSVKEFHVDHISTRRRVEGLRSPVYDFMQEGDVGTLTYKELENATWRQFLNFKKGPAHGGGDVKTGVHVESKKGFWSACIICVVIILSEVFGVIYFKKNEGKRPRNKRHKTKRVDVVGKRIRTHKGIKSGGRTISHTYLVSFRFPGGSVKELKVGMDYSTSGHLQKESCCEAYNAIHEGGTGILTYLEIKDTGGMLTTKSKKFISFEETPSVPSS